MTTTTASTRAALTALLLTAAVLVAVRQGGGYWQLAAFGLGPDLALLYGAARGLAKGRLHPRAVGLYNLLHRSAGPLLLGAFALSGLVPRSFLVGALAWGFH